eukprot:TRINITY_DN3196_c0_g2_i13.p1 TRINITY_DN3196_c0_g2~~TRINITY_DN3196_c0_g2_i13.p1  ORF type:complete len:137 (-),score=28.37 TRINITY_DN3196_c0_g2_i13:98-508(-)
MAGVKTKRSPNWTPLEVDHLLYASNSKAENRERRTKAWEYVHKKFHKKTEFNRSVESIITKYKNIKENQNREKKNFDDLPDSAFPPPPGQFEGQDDAVEAPIITQSDRARLLAGKARREELKNQFFTNYNRAHRRH